MKTTVNSVKLIVNLSPSGLHARPCALVVSLLLECFREHEIVAVRKLPETGEMAEVNAKSVMGLVSLAVGPGEEFDLISPMPDGQWKVLVSILTSFFYGRAGEGDDGYGALVKILKQECGLGRKPVRAALIEKKLNAVNPSIIEGKWFSRVPEAEPESPTAPEASEERSQEAFERVISAAGAESNIRMSVLTDCLPPLDDEETDAEPREVYPSDVFLSFASGDRDIADTVCAFLEDQGMRCRMAPRDVPSV